MQIHRNKVGDCVQSSCDSLEGHLTMNEQLERIASLNLQKAEERFSREMQEKLSALSGMPRGGELEAAKLAIRLDRSENVCQECSRIWVDLLETKNSGYLTREDVDF